MIGGRPLNTDVCREVERFILSQRVCTKHVHVAVSLQEHFDNDTPNSILQFKTFSEMCNRTSLCHQIFSIILRLDASQGHVLRDLYARR